MKQLMKTAVAAALLALSGMDMASAEALKVGIGAEPYPPFTSPDASGKWVGWEIDMIEAVCAEAKVECVVTPVAWDGIIPALTSKKIDMIMNSMSITEERKKTIDFSDKYYNTPTGIVGTTGVQMDATAEGLKGKILGVQGSTVHETYAKKHFGDSLAELKTYQTQDEANQDLAAGRIDATQADSDRPRHVPPVRPGQGLLRAEGYRCRGSGDFGTGHRRGSSQGRHRTQGKDKRCDKGAPRQRQI